MIVKILFYDCPILQVPLKTDKSQFIGLYKRTFVFTPTVLLSAKSFLSHMTTFPKIKGLLHWDCHVIRVFHNKHNLNSCTTMRNHDGTGRARAHSLVTWLCQTTITRRIVSPSSPLLLYALTAPAVSVFPRRRATVGRLYERHSLVCGRRDEFSPI